MLILFVITGGQNYFKIYKDLNIGTAKVTEEEKQGIEHHLFDIRDVTEEYSVFDYQNDARRLIEEKNKTNNKYFFFRYNN